MVSMIRAKDDAAYDSALANYKSFLDKNNWDKIVEIRSEKMKANREKLGLK
jgi:putative aldouronate transport system substrate-binding protein